MFVGTGEPVEDRVKNERGGDEAKSRGVRRGWAQGEKAHSILWS